MTRARIVRIITRLNVGGPAIQALSLTEHLDPERYESILIAGAPAPHEGDMEQLRPGSVTPIRVGALVRQVSPRLDTVAFVQLVRLLRRLRPDLVHTHLAKAGALGRIAARLSGARAVVHTFHGNVLRGYFGSSRTTVFTQVERSLARITDRIVSISPRQTAELLSMRIAPAAKIAEVPLGFDLTPFLSVPRGVLRRELGIADEVPLVGIVARLTPIKGVDVFLRSARRVQSEMAHARFVIVGDGELRADLEALTRELDLTRSVTFLGWRRDLAPVYADLDVVALTSHNEGTPVTLIEAATAARPIVATAVGGVPDVIGGDAGLLVPDGDVDGLASAMLRIIRDPALGSSLGAAARGRVYPFYDRANLLARIDALYRDLLDH